MAASLWHSLTHYFDFSGTASRREYLIFVGFNLGLSLVLYLLSLVSDLSLFPFLGRFLSLALLLPGMAVTVRRLHAVGRSGWWLLVAATGIGVFLLGWWLLSPGDSPTRQGENAYASSPR